MGHTINPVSFRLGWVHFWLMSQSVAFTLKSYSYLYRWDMSFDLFFKWFFSDFFIIGNKKFFGFKDLGIFLLKSIIIRYNSNVRLNLILSDEYFFSLLSEILKIKKKINQFLFQILKRRKVYKVFKARYSKKKKFTIKTNIFKNTSFINVMFLKKRFVIKEFKRNFFFRRKISFKQRNRNTSKKVLEQTRVRIFEKLNSKGFLKTRRKKIKRGVVSIFNLLKLLKKKKILLIKFLRRKKFNRFSKKNKNIFKNKKSAKLNHRKKKIFKRNFYLSFLRRFNFILLQIKKLNNFLIKYKIFWFNICDLLSTYYRPLFFCRDMSICIFLNKNRCNFASFIFKFIMSLLLKQVSLFRILRILHSRIFSKNLIQGKICGYKIICSGRFTRKERATYRWVSFGKVSASAMSIKADVHFDTVTLKYGICGIKIYIYKFYNFDLQNLLPIIQYKI